METIRKEILPGVWLTALESDKFKTGCLSISMLTQLDRETAAQNALIPYVLRRGSRYHTDMRSLAAELDGRTLIERALDAVPKGMFAAVCVRDNGPGITEAEQPKVFQRFYRGANHQNEEGVGIGLYLARQIAEGQGGYIKVSASPGSGSTFCLYLPRS